MFTKTEKTLISIIITLAILAVMTFFLEDPREASAAEQNLIVWEPVETELPSYNIEKFSNPAPVVRSGGVVPPFDGTTPETLHEIPSSTATSQGRLTKSKGVHQGPSGRETWYSLDMTGVIQIMRGLGYTEEEYPYTVDADGIKRFGGYVMIAANLQTRPKGTILPTSWGDGIVVDTGSFTSSHPDGIDIATNWSGR